MVAQFHFCIWDSGGMLLNTFTQVPCLRTTPYNTTNTIIILITLQFFTFKAYDDLIKYDAQL